MSVVILFLHHTNTTMRKIIFATIFAATCSVTIAQSGSSKDPYLTKSFKDVSFKKINAETSHGNITVSIVPASDAKVEVYVNPTNDNDRLTKEEIQKKLDEYYSIDISVSGDLLSAIVHKKKEILYGQNALNISFKIYAAKNTDTHLRTSHGNVDVSGLEGREDMATSHGNIALEKITGKLTAQTSHGNISITGSKDDIDVRTSHGNIEAKNCEGIVTLITSSGNVQFEQQKGKIKASTDHGNVAGVDIAGELSAYTSHGDVELKNLSCSVETSTSHGNIAVSVNNITGDIIINNSSGNISLTLPKGKGIDVDLSGKPVTLDATENFSGSKEKNSMKGTLNGGGTKVKAKTNHGTVDLRFRS